MSTKLYVGNLPFQTTEIRSAGAVRSVRPGCPRSASCATAPPARRAALALSNGDAGRAQQAIKTWTRAHTAAGTSPSTRRSRWRRAATAAAAAALAAAVSAVNRAGKLRRSLPFTALHLHPDLLKGIRELGFARPTPIQADAIPPALAGRDVLACAQTGSGKTAAFLLPILHRLIGKPRGTTRALVLTPTRELAAQILEDFNALAVHTPLTGAAVFGGVGMGPQEHAFRSGVDVIVATPGRLLDHFSASVRASSSGLEYLVLDEADRMLDMGFLPDIRRILRHIPAEAADAVLQRDDAAADRGAGARDAEATRRRSACSGRSAPAVGITQAVYPVPQELKAALLVAAARARHHDAGAGLHAHQAPRQPPGRAAWCRHGINAERIHGNRSQAQRTRGARRLQERASIRVLVATDIAARGIDVEALEPRRQLRRAGGAGRLHPPRRPHRPRRADGRGVHVRGAGRGSRTCARSSARSAGALPRVTLPDFDYTARPQAQLEVPLAERIAAIRAQKAEERERAARQRRAASGQCQALGTLWRTQRRAGGAARATLTEQQRAATTIAHGPAEAGPHEAGRTTDAAIAERGHRAGGGSGLVGVGAAGEEAESRTRMPPRRSAAAMSAPTRYTSMASGSRSATADRSSAGAISSAVATVTAGCSRTGRRSGGRAPMCPPT